MRTPHEENDAERFETDDWISALEATARHAGADRARRLLGALERHAKESGLLDELPTYLPYRNTIALDQQPPHPGDVELEERITSIIRWNALAMVVRANRAHGELGGHIASYASAAEIFEMGFNHFFSAGSGGGRGDLIYFQPHSSPGVYARSFLEGRLDERHLAHYRQEITGPGLCSYPHPWLMPDFWQFPTGSMGIGVINSVYQARFLRYLRDRGLSNGDDRRVWGVFGDGEMDEPESLGGLALAAREGLDNLTFIVNCNLQRLDGPVRGNGQIIPELESMFRGFGWNVIKVLWGSEWDPLFARDKTNALLRRFAETVDGKYQTLGAKGGAYNLANFFSEDPDTRALVAHMSEQDVDGLKRGGHDFRKLYAAFKAATDHKGRPTVILAKTKKGYGMGGAGESRMTSHQAKKLDLEALLAFRDRFSLPLTDKQVEDLDFYRPAEDSREIDYIKSRRTALGGMLPARRREAPTLAIPPLRDYAAFALDASGKESSTTVAAVRVLSNLLKDKLVGPRVVPIVADEARTFGMANLFRQIGIYSPVGQLYEPEDAGSMLFYKESKTGQLLEEGINEAGAISSWTAAATSYSVSGEPMLPFYIYYSMFGFQRVGDLIWAAADQRARGFLIGATAGRTTLGGEGLQHQDGSSHLIASTIPNCRSFDPAYAYEMAVILDYGARRMLEQQTDEFFYITAMNENYAQPSMPEGVEDDIARGMYRFSGDGHGVLRLLGSGAILPEIAAAAETLRSHAIPVDVYSVTSFGELAREARELQRQSLLRPGQPLPQSHLARMLPGDRPIIAATDYVRAYPQLIAPYLNAPFVALGTDGFGRSDTRAALRSFFEVDRAHVVFACLSTLLQRGEMTLATFARATTQLNVTPAAEAPWRR
ncbi:MAG: alpha-ketoglutarate dehydrogenase [Hyphomonadaceae bacterium]